jgi:outer membrane usher protein
VRIEAEDLPLDAQIDTLQLEAIPYFRSGLLLTFPVRPSRGALLTLVLDNGTPVPAGAVVKVSGHEQEFPVALRGEVYVTGLAARNQLQATWRDQTCTFTVQVLATAEPLPHLGPFLCTGVQP